MRNAISFNPRTRHFTFCLLDLFYCQTILYTACIIRLILEGNLLQANGRATESDLLTVSYKTNQILVNLGTSLFPDIFWENP